MPLFTYTTKVSTDKTVAEIQKILVTIGARSVLYDYNDKGYIIAVSFRLKVGEADLSYRLPVEWQPVLKVLERQRVPQSLQTQEQALRVAWRILKYWVEAQAAIIETQMVTTEQVFLPYTITSDGTTLYDKFKNNPQLLVGGA
jgi:hypothetical protein